MRRLPVYLLVYTSGSMRGEPIEAVNNGIKSLVATLRQDPQALESVHMSVIVFAGKAQVLVSMVELANFYLPSLPIGGGTSLNAALTTLMGGIDTHVVKGSGTQRSDWKPMVLLITSWAPSCAQS